MSLSLALGIETPGCFGDVLCRELAAQKSSNTSDACLSPVLRLRGWPSWSVCERSTWPFSGTTAVLLDALLAFLLSRGFALLVDQEDPARTLPVTKDRPCREMAEVDGLLTLTK